MKTSSRKLPFLTLLILLAAAFVCMGSLSTVYAAKQKPAVTESKITLFPDYEDYQIELTGLEEESTVSFSSTKPSVASVDEEGLVTAHKKGSTTIKVKVSQNSKKYTLKLKVTVKDPYYSVTASTEGIFVNDSFTFTVDTHGYDGDVKWTLAGSQYANLSAVSDSDCKVSGIAPGYVTLKLETLGQTETFSIRIYEGSGSLFVIHPNTAPYYSSYKSRSDYNKNTKHYFLIRSYLEKLSATGGGMLVLKEGTYTITNTLCIPSNTTILLEDGVKIVKSDYTGVSWLPATGSLFQTVAYSHTSTPFSGYKGEHDIAIIGEGGATIDINNIMCGAIVCCHVTNLTVKGIRFLNMNTYHFIELDATKNAVISGNYFAGCTASTTARKEAINIDTPDELTHGFNQTWSSFDKTPVKNIYITDNVFENLESAIGTHKYSEDKYHTDVNISGNTFINMSAYAIRAMNWKNPVIIGNVFYNTRDFSLQMTITEDGDTSTLRKGTIMLNGVVGPVITGNLFENCANPITAYHWKNFGAGKSYAITYNDLSEADIAKMKKNRIIDCDTDYIEYFYLYKDFTSETLTMYHFTE